MQSSNKNQITMKQKRSQTHKSGKIANIIMWLAKCALENKSIGIKVNGRTINQGI